MKSIEHIRSKHRRRNKWAYLPKQNSKTGQVYEIRPGDRPEQTEAQPIRKPRPVRDFLYKMIQYICGEG